MITLVMKTRNIKSVFVCQPALARTIVFMNRPILKAAYQCTTYYRHARTHAYTHAHTHTYTITHPHRHTHLHTHTLTFFIPFYVFIVGLGYVWSQDVRVFFYLYYLRFDLFTYLCCVHSSWHK